MKHIVAWFSLLALFGVPITHAVEILRWDRIPLAVSLVVGEERVILVDRNVRVGVPPSITDRLRVQSAGSAMYLRASAPIETTRLELQDTVTGTLILIDVTALPATQGAPSLEPVRIVDATQSAKEGSDREAIEVGAENATVRRAPGAPAPIPVAVVLTRHAAQSLYSPLRTLEPVPGIAGVPIRGSLPLETLLPGLPIRATALVAWRLEDVWITAVRLTHTAEGWLELDPRALQGDFVTATFQHQMLGPAGDACDTTVVYLVTRGHGLAESLLPAISAVNADLNRQNSDRATGRPRGATP